MWPFHAAFLGVAGEGSLEEIFIKIKALLRGSLHSKQRLWLPGLVSQKVPVNFKGACQPHQL